MKKLLGTLAFTCLTFIAFSQKIVVTGIVLDNITYQPLSGATVTINNQSIITDDDGIFVFKKITKQNFSIEVSIVGYANFNETTTSAAAEKSIIIKMKSIALNLQALEVKSIKHLLQKPTYLKKRLPK